MWFSALVTAANLALAATVGLRLVWRARRGESGPEIWLSGYFLCGAFLSSLVNIVLYSSLGEAGLAISPEAFSIALTGSAFATGVAGTCVYVFNWKTFRAGSPGARALVIGAAGVFAATWAFQAATGRFVLVVMPGAAFWIERSVFFGGFAWAAAESFRYHASLRRRLRIGLAEPVVVNRLWLWGAWASATGLLALSELVARVAYVWTTGETQLVLVDRAMPIIVATVATTSIVGSFAVASLWLTFFPSRRYLAWIARRQPVGAGHPA
jgi:hypothetical protein